MEPEVPQGQEGARRQDREEETDGQELQAKARHFDEANPVYAQLLLEIEQSQRVEEPEDGPTLVFGPGPEPTAESLDYATQTLIDTPTSTMAAAASASASSGEEYYPPDLSSWPLSIVASLPFPQLQELEGLHTRPGTEEAVALFFPWRGDYFCACDCRAIAQLGHGPCPARWRPRA